MGLSDEDVQKIVAYVKKHGLSTRYAADKYGVSQRRVQQLVQEFDETGAVPIIKQRGRKPRTDYPDDIEERVIQVWTKLHVGATSIAKYLREKDGIKIADIKVHEILLENNMASENDNKKGRKKRRNIIPTLTRLLTS